MQLCQQFVSWCSACCLGFPGWSFFPRGSKYPWKVSGSKNHTLKGSLGPESVDIGYLDRLS